MNRVIALLLWLSAGAFFRRRHKDDDEGAETDAEPTPSQEEILDQVAEVAEAEPEAASEPEPEPEPEFADEGEEAEEAGPEQRGRFRRRVGRAVGSLGRPFGALRRKGRVDEATFDELEEALLLADVGLPTTSRLLDPLRAGIRSGALSADADAVLEALRAEVEELFWGEDRALDRSGDGPAVWLFVGVNGVGKTTTIGKIASRATRAGDRVVIAAGDTFRAAAGEQLELWARPAGAEIVRGADGADPSSVVFDAIEHAAAVSADLVLADTAGRLHTRTNLMEELKKVRRVADRPEGRVREVLLVIDATTGQNGLAQAREFTNAVGVTGIVLTKLDGTAKGGIVLSIRSELGLPIKLVGLGEGADDLVPFDPEEFAAALFA